MVRDVCGRWTGVRSRGRVGKLWVRNLAALCAAQLLTLIGFSSYLPFIPFFVQELGVESYDAAVTWSAAFSSGAAVAMMVFQPIWGVLADRVGRKPMLVRATAAGAVLAFGMSLARTPEMLVVIRVLQGVFCGTVAAALTLVASETPDNEMGFALGLMQTAQFVGNAIGPLLGGAISDAYGARTVFWVSSGLMVVSVTVILAMVREERKPEPGSQHAISLRPMFTGMRQVVRGSSAVLLAALASVSFGAMVVSPILSLYVQSLAPDAANLGTLAGSVTAASSVTSSAAAFVLGRAGDRLGQRRVLIVCVLGGAALFFPQAMVRSPYALLGIRALQGAFMGGVLPTANALLARLTPSSRRGSVFGLASSLQAGGRAIGPMVGAAAASAWTMGSSFVVAGAVFLAIGLGVLLFVHPPNGQEAKASPAELSAKRLTAGTSGCGGPST
jgi:MFS transporter, DHA1 family, multidrug resistance protein